MANCSFQWRNFQDSFASGLGQLQQNGEFVDMTIAADGHIVKVHQLVMSLASPYLKEVILSAPCPHPVIHLTNVPFNILSGILEYIYTGEVTIEKGDMELFLTVARNLKIKGLQYGMDNVPSESTMNTLKRAASKQLADVIPKKRFTATDFMKAIPTPDITIQEKATFKDSDLVIKNAEDIPNDIAEAIKAQGPQQAMLMPKEEC